jgi:hypothetical protein
MNRLTKVWAGEISAGTEPLEDCKANQYGQTVSACQNYSPIGKTENRN